jgi:hypothetical protein
MHPVDIENLIPHSTNASQKEVLRKECISDYRQAITESDFLHRFPELLKHLKYGDIRKGKSFGIHVFDYGLHRVRESIHPANKRGIWEAKIDVRHPKTNAWVQKEKSSTLFPIGWTEELLISKLTYAFKNSKIITPFKYRGITDCGIRIVFIFQNNDMSCCYPLWE